MKTLVLGLGNPLLRDDSIGLRVAQAMRPLLSDHQEITVAEDYWGGLRLMERMIGYDRAIIIDAILTGSKPGTIHRLSPGSIATQRSTSSHDVNLTTALQVGRESNAHLPRDENIHLIGIEAKDIETFDEQLSPELELAVPAAVRAVLQALELKGEIG
jgi:hydrogenase maturation protease